MTPNSEASAYSVLTDGRIFPVSICEIELGREIKPSRELAQPDRLAEANGAEPRTKLGRGVRAAGAGGLALVVTVGGQRMRAMPVQGAVSLRVEPGCRSAPPRRSGSPGRCTATSGRG